MKKTLKSSILLSLSSVLVMSSYVPVGQIHSPYVFAEETEVSESVEEEGPTEEDLLLAESLQEEEDYLKRIKEEKDNEYSKELKEKSEKLLTELKEIRETLKTRGSKDLNFDSFAFKLRDFKEEVRRYLDEKEAEKSIAESKSIEESVKAAESKAAEESQKVEEKSEAEQAKSEESKEETSVESSQVSSESVESISEELSEEESSPEVLESESRSEDTGSSGETGFRNAPKSVPTTVTHEGEFVVKVDSLKAGDTMIEGIATGAKDLHYDVEIDGVAVPIHPANLFDGNGVQHSGTFSRSSQFVVGVPALKKGQVVTFKILSYKGELLSTSTFVVGDENPEIDSNSTPNISNPAPKTTPDTSQQGEQVTFEVKAGVVGGQVVAHTKPSYTVEVTHHKVGSPSYTLKSVADGNGIARSGTQSGVFHAGDVISYNVYDTAGKQVGSGEYVVPGHSEYAEAPVLDSVQAGDTVISGTARPNSKVRIWYRTDGKPAEYLGEIFGGEVMSDASGRFVLDLANAKLMSAGHPNTLVPNPLPSGTKVFASVIINHYQGALASASTGGSTSTNNTPIKPNTGSGTIIVNKGGVQNGGQPNGPRRPADSVPNTDTNDSTNPLKVKKLEAIQQDSEQREQASQQQTQQRRKAPLPSTGEPNSLILLGIASLFALAGVVLIDKYSRT